MKPVVSVAVVGAGAAGLCALRLFGRCTTANATTFRATAFEQSTRVGGTWLYTDCVGTDEQGLPVHSSMYKSLRTNLPKECMAYPDYPFPSHLPSFITHEDVQKYLEDYTTHFDLWPLIKFQTIVEYVKPIRDENNKFGVKWEVTTANVRDRADRRTETFDAVLVCNGHYAKPLMPDIPGLESFGGLLLHSHNYREPSAFAGKTVVVLGAQSSGQDISVEVASEASQVYLSHNKPRLTTYLPPNLHQKPGIKYCHKRVVEFRDGSALEVDAIVLCTGYHYDFHFLDESIGLKVTDERITPLYKHLLSVKFPSLCLIGMLKSILPFPLFHQQMKYFRSILDASGFLPCETEMLDEEDKELSRLKELGLHPRYFHTLAHRQFDYNNQLADLGNFERLDPIIENIYNACHHFRRANVTTYRNINFVLCGDGKFKVVDDRKT